MHEGDVKCDRYQVDQDCQLEKVWILLREQIPEEGYEQDAVVVEEMYILRPSGVEQDNTANQTKSG